MSGRAVPAPALPQTATEFASAQARAAWERGGAAMREQNFDEARRWFARACRIAPDDVTARLSLAGAWLSLDRPEAAAPLFQDVAERTDARMAWLAAAVAFARADKPDAAAAALHVALSRHAGQEPAIAAGIAAVAKYPGWCGLDEAGRVIGRIAGGGMPRLRLDGARVSGGFGFVPSSQARMLHVTVAGRALLGSPLRLDAIRRLEGLVEVDGAGIVGWAWHPGQPGRQPVLTLLAGTGDAAVTRRILPADPDVPALRPLAQPRGFRLAASELAGLPEPLVLVGPDGAAIAGSPVSPLRLAASIPHPVETPPRTAAAAPRRPGRPVAVIVPVYRGLRETALCLRDLVATLPAGSLAIVIDDASPEAALAAHVDILAASGRVRLLRLDRNGGFPVAANAGLRAALALDPPHDAVLLNSDTRLPPGWLERLRGAAHGSGDIGSATPFCNDGSIASYPDAAGGGVASGGVALARLAAATARANAGVVVDAPTGVGFCLYLRHECLAETGLLREDAFAQGYGEENDFCLRARRHGWRHVIVPGAYVAHVGGRSFGPARPALLARNLRVLENLHPGYRALVDGWIAGDPLAPSRRRLDLLRWTAHARAMALVAPRGGVLLVTHDDGGGVERCVQARRSSLREAGYWPVLLRPVLNPDGRAERRTVPGALRLDEAGWPNLIFCLPQDETVLDVVLRRTKPAWLEVHHLLGHAHSVLDVARRLAIPYDMRLHDYAAFCPRITLTHDGDRYCGEPDVAGCEACIARNGSLLEEAIGPAALRARSAADLAGARRVVVPSADMAMRMRRHFPHVAMQVLPHEPDPDAPPQPAAAPPGAPVRVVVVGAIGGAKGFDILLACARDAADRGLALRFVVVGRTIDDDRLLASGCAEVTGPYREGEAAALIAEQRGQRGFVPSLWPETWCFALGEMLRAGLPVLAFDIGAQAERIRRGGGWLLPLGAPPATINRLLLRPPQLLRERLAAAPNVMQTGHLRALTELQPTPEGTP